jgi:quinol monooxygenase YgiN
MAYVVVVRLVANPAGRPLLLDLLHKNAATSLSDEPGCRQFDVVELDDDGEVLLYEVYANRVAFDAHLESRHFKAFDDASRPLVATKHVATGHFSFPEKR